MLNKFSNYLNNIVQPSLMIVTDCILIVMIVYCTLRIVQVANFML